VVISCCYKVAPATSTKVVKACTGSNCDMLAAIVVGLIAGCFQVIIYNNLFNMAFVGQSMPDSLLYAGLARIGHVAPIYAIVFTCLAVVVAYASDLVSKSMDSAETRGYMK